MVQTGFPREAKNLIRFLGFTACPFSPARLSLSNWLMWRGRRGDHGFHNSVTATGGFFWGVAII